jgi:hypothetical protein
MEGEHVSLTDPSDERRITAGMTILEIVERYPQTEAVIRKYDEQANVCLCCQALFEPLDEMAKKYGLNLETLLNDLNGVTV